MSTPSGDPCVTVVIPTTLKRDIAPALRSARDQDVRTQVVLVVDAAESSTLPAGVSSLVDQVLFTGGGAGAARARNLGVAAATADWIAYLDDDDEWLAGKIGRQLRAASERPDPRRVVVSCRVRQRAAGSTELSSPVPASTYRSPQPVADYLFRRRGLRVTRNAIFLPTLLVHRDLAVSTPWNEALRRHQDWDWLLRAGASGADLVQLDDVLALITVGSPGSISASSDWHSSLAWARSRRELMSRAAYSDFVAGQVLRFALGARSGSGVRAVAGELRHGPRPSSRSLALGLSGLVPRRGLEAAAFLLDALPRRLGQGAASSRRHASPTTSAS